MGMLDGVGRWLFDPTGLTPHGFCLLWEPELIWIHALSDIAVGLAYFSIPLALLVFLRRRRDLAFRPVFVLFAAFILLCGAGHWLSLLTLWVPAYGIEGLVKAATALVSVLTAVSIWLLMPQALALPSPGQLREANTELVERERQAIELKRLNADLQQFAYVVSHDLKAPLRAIMHLADWINDDLLGTAPAETMEHVGLMRRRAERLQMLLDSLLNYTLADHGKAPPEIVDLETMVAGIVDLLAPPDPVAVRFEGEAVVVRTPRAPLEHVLQNLISNAIKHHDRAQADIVVSARNQGGVVVFCVADDGPGIAPKFHDRIFTIFQTIAARDDKETSGVGLSIVKKIVERAGGRVWVESEPPRRGSRFCFTWPTDVPERQAPPEAMTGMQINTAA